MLELFLPGGNGGVVSRTKIVAMNYKLLLLFINAVLCNDQK
jgi:hypothetical protein